MRRAGFILVSLSALSLAFPTSLIQAAEIDATACSKFKTDLKVEGGAIDAATFKPAEGATPAYCRVEGALSPEPGSHIGFAVNLPASNWNARFLMFGNGGYAGELSSSTKMMDRGFATAVTDAGHRQPNGSAFRDNYALKIDYGWRAIHDTQAASKQILDQVYGQPPKTSYFDGCSTGGRQALMEAERFPDDFNGILAGAPALDLTGLAVEQNWSMRQFFKDDFAGDIAGKVDLLAAAVRKQCGGPDGLVDDPTACKFDPRALQCEAGADPATCLTPRQVEAVSAVYHGPENHSGFAYPGKPVGSEASWAHWIVPSSANNMRPLQGGFTFNFMNVLFFDRDPPAKFAWTDFDFEHDPARGAFMSMVLNATDPDLTKFRDRGGKIILYHGLGDGLIGYGRTLQFYEAVEDKAGGRKSAQDFARLFLEPGMDHCGFGGGGLIADDWSPAIQDWVENGKAPERVAATQRENKQVLRTRPLCPWPSKARWTEKGSRDEAANWICAD